MPSLCHFPELVWWHAGNEFEAEWDLKDFSRLTYLIHIQLNNNGFKLIVTLILPCYCVNIISDMKSYAGIAWHW
jgi:hypothetical protein